jgi:GT2 family glycosyltransferase
MSGLSVVICTFRRANLLTDVLTRLLRQTQAPAEVLLVDNEVSGEVEGLVTRLATQAPFPIRYLPEPALGLSHARNRGVREARAPLVAFLDDDAFAAPGWVAALLRGAEAHPAAGVFAGRVEPITDGPLPPNFLEEIGNYAAWLGAIDLGPGDLPLLNQGATYAGPVGANMMFRREALASAGAFDPALGRVGTALISGEEVAVVNAARAAGFEVWYLGQASVEHLVHRDRLTHRWFLERAYFEGVSIARALRAQGDAAARGAALEQQCVKLCGVLEHMQGALPSLPLKTRIELLKLAGRAIESSHEPAAAALAQGGLARLRANRELLGAGLPDEGLAFWAKA